MNGAATVHVKAHRPQVFTRLDWPNEGPKTTVVPGWRYKKHDPRAFAVVDGTRSFSAWELRPVGDFVSAFDRRSDNVRRHTLDNSDL
jgi:hypothetical protein